MMDRRLILLLIPLLLAGCTAFSGGGEASDAPPAQGLVIKEASLQNTAIPQDGKTELTLHLANTGTTKIEDATIAISNTGPLEVTGQPAGDKCDIGPQPFTGVSVGAATEGVPRRVICRVTIIGADAREGEYPLTVRVQYGNTLRMQKDSPTITFDDQQNLAAPPVTRTYSNGETSLGVTVPPRVPKDEDSVELELRFQNVGQGRVVATEKDALPAASISVDGGTFTDSLPGACSTVRIQEGESSGTASCTLATPSVSSSPSTHTLRLKANYTYERHREIPIRVVKQD